MPASQPHAQSCTGAENAAKAPFSAGITRIGRAYGCSEILPDPSGGQHLPGMVDAPDVLERLRSAIQLSCLLCIGSLIFWYTGMDMWAAELVKTAPAFDFLHSFGAWYSNWGLYPFYTLFMVLLVRGHSRCRSRWVVLARAYFLAQACGTFALVHLLKMIFDRPRPFEHLLQDTLLNVPDLTHAMHSSFPSSHTVDAMVGAVFIALFWRGKGIRSLAIIAAMLMGVSRVLVGKHYPSDVLAGSALAIGIIAITVRIYLLPRWSLSARATD